MTSEAGPSNTAFGASGWESDTSPRGRLSDESISPGQCRDKYVTHEIVIRNNKVENVDDNNIVEERSFESSFGTMRSNDSIIGINLHDVFNDLISIPRHNGSNDPTFVTRHNVSEASNFDHDDTPDDSSVVPRGDTIPRGDVGNNPALHRHNPVVIAHGGKKFYHSIKFWSLTFVIIIILLVGSAVLYFIIFPPNLDVEDLTFNINSFSMTDTPMSFNGTFLLQLYNPHSTISFHVHHAVVTLDFDHGGHISKKIPPMSFKAHDQKLIIVDFFEKNLGFDGGIYTQDAVAGDNYFFNITIDSRMKVHLDSFGISYPRHVVRICPIIVEGHPHPYVLGYFCHYL